MGIAYSYFFKSYQKTLLKKGCKKRFFKKIQMNMFAINLGSFWQLENLLENFP